MIADATSPPRRSRRRRPARSCCRPPRADAVHADVDHDRAGLDEVALDQARSTDGRDQHVRARAHRAQIARARVADRDGRVLGQQQLRHRLAEQVRASDDDRLGACRAGRRRCAAARSRPSGVHGRRPGRPSASRPALTGVRPSTSLSGSIIAVSAGASRWPGSGSCSSTPLTAGSSFRLASSAATCAKLASAGRRWSIAVMPTSAQARCLPPTYTAEAGSSPTSTVARPGARAAPLHEARRLAAATSRAHARGDRLAVDDRRRHHAADRSRPHDESLRSGVTRRRRARARP